MTGSAPHGSCAVFEQALLSADRVGELPRLAQKILDDGCQPDAVLTRFEQARQSLREADREADEDAVMDVMDFLSGWCSPHVTLDASPSPTTGLPSIRPGSLNVLNVLRSLWKWNLPKPNSWR